jgi:hypothetical protein
MLIVNNEVEVPEEFSRSCREVPETFPGSFRKRNRREFRRESISSPGFLLGRV